LNDDTVADFLAKWSRVSELVEELHERLYVAKTVDTADAIAEARYTRYLDEIYPASREAEQALKQRLLGSGLQPKGFEIPLLKLRAEADLFREENLSLLAEEQKLSAEYDRIVGAQTVEWRGEELPIPRVRLLYQETDRDVREEAWRLAIGRQMADRDAINELWRRFLGVRLQLASNADLPDYREYRWRQLLRFDYRPEDNKAFHEAVHDIVVPASERILERRRTRLDLQSLRPWDLDVDPLARPPLRPFTKTTDLVEGTARIFDQVDRQLGSYFRIMEDGSLLDLESRKNKAPGGYCTSFPAVQEPFIFMNAAGSHNDVQTLLHEGGHAFHVFESRHLPYEQQRNVGSEFAEVASMAMELLASPYLSRERGGFYSAEDAARARVEYLESIILLWGRLAYTDAFQHWVYENPDAAADPDECDREWASLYARYLPSVDWTGLEAEMAAGWHRILHIHVAPFYVIEYSMAQLAAVQVWSRALSDQVDAVARYRSALSLGGTRSLPALYEAVGAKFDFGPSAMAPAVALIEEVIGSLESGGVV
jgi:oligoendopeptidase F